MRPFTAAAAGRALEAGETTARELVEACLARIAAHDGRLNSFVHVTAEQARAAALEADRAIRDGRRRGPLHGIPFALKDVFETIDAPPPPIRACWPMAAGRRGIARWRGGCGMPAPS